MTELSGVHHLKIPVSDVGRSRAWYEQALQLHVVIEFEEDGVVRGVALTDAGETVQIALRCDPERAAALAGFDPIALAVPTPAEVDEWRSHLDAGGHPHGGIVTGHGGGSVLVGLRDPDGIEIRLYAEAPR